MQEFNFYVDKKVTIWVREKYSIKTENEEQAKEVMIDKFNRDDIYDLYYNDEYLYETIEELTPEENQNNPTEELYFENGELLADNLNNITLTK